MKTSEGKDASWLSVTGRDGKRREGITRVEAGGVGGHLMAAL